MVWLSHLLEGGGSACAIALPAPVPAAPSQRARNADSLPGACFIKDVLGKSREGKRDSSLSVVSVFVFSGNFRASAQSLPTAAPGAFAV